ncbi:WAT1-related protein At1g25270 [Quercus suber]|uniref:WAT1-related protein At1g25270 n=1 Tax=Quercus suber TaxID=58331 RepID=UPI0032DEA041
MVMESACNVLHGLKPTILMVVVQFAFAGVNVFYKLAVNDGMNLRVIVAYRFLFASAFIAPLAFVLERKTRPKLTWVVMFQAFICGLLGGTLAQNLYFESFAFTSATFAVAMSNLNPAITFVLATSVGLEKPAVGTLGGMTRIAGTVVGIGGAMLFTLYRGVKIDLWSTHVDLLHCQEHVAPSHPGSSRHVIGALFCLASSLSYALWLIIQAKMNESYPCLYSGAALICTMSFLQSIVFALCTERDWSQWKLSWDLRLLTAAYSGIVCSGVVVAVIAWCIQARGPMFISIFNPLSLVIVALVGSLVLEEELHLGRNIQKRLCEGEQEGGFIFFDETAVTAAQHRLEK